MGRRSISISMKGRDRRGGEFASGASRAPTRRRRLRAILQWLLRRRCRRCRQRAPACAVPPQLLFGAGPASAPTGALEPMGASAPPCGRCAVTYRHFVKLSPF